MIGGRNLSNDLSGLYHPVSNQLHLRQLKFQNDASWGKQNKSPLETEKFHELTK
jgi:hypothetical protein